MAPNEIRTRAIEILKRHGISRAGLFGSAALGELGEQSDIDILFESPSGMTLFSYLSLRQELADVLGRKIDLVEYKAIKPALRTDILKAEEQLRLE